MVMFHSELEYDRNKKQNWKRRDMQAPENETFQP